MLWLYVLQEQTCLSLGFVPNLVLKLLLRKNYLLCLRFWFGGNIERELGEAFSAPQSTVRESEVSDEDLFVHAQTFADGKLPPLVFVFCFFSFGRSSLDRNGFGMFVPSYFLLKFSLNPFITQRFTYPYEVFLNKFLWPMC